MSNLNGYHGTEHYSQFTESEWQELQRAADGEIAPGAVTSLLRRVVSNIGMMGTDGLRLRCAELCEMRTEWQI